MTNPSVETSWANKRLKTSSVQFSAFGRANGISDWSKLPAMFYNAMYSTTTPFTYVHT